MVIFEAAWMLAKSSGGSLEQARKGREQHAQALCTDQLDMSASASALFDALVLPMPRCGCKVCFCDYKVGTRVTMQAEPLHAQLLLACNGICTSEAGRHPLAVHWQRRVDSFRQQER